MIVLFLLSITCPVLAWNALGHRLIGQIAYDHLNSATKKHVNFYNHLLNSSSDRRSFVNAAPWLDYYRVRTILGLPSKPIHYIDIHFSLDGTALKDTPTPNALTAIQKAKSILQNPQSSDYDKALSVRVLLHVIGDLHQPLHAADQMSRRYPNGDHGGNLFPLAKNDVGKNLHAYWDRGGGLLVVKDHVTNKTLRNSARHIEEKWPCSGVISSKNDPQVWSHESFELAVSKAYRIKPFQIPSLSYQKMTQAQSEKQIALAGCRMAEVFNQFW